MISKQADDASIQARLLRDLWRRYRWRVVGSLVASVAAGLCSAALLAFINSAIQQTEGVIPTVAWVFAGLCLIVLVSGVLSAVLLTHLGQELALDLRMRLCQSILSAPLRQLHTLGRHRLLASLTEDIETITGSCEAVPALGVALATIIGCLGYLGWLSWELLLIVVSAMAVGVIALQWVQHKAMRWLEIARVGTDRLFDHFRALTEGTKELKIHRRRRHVFVEEHLRATGNYIRSNFIRGIYLYTVAINFGNLLFYGLIGVVLFAAPVFTETSSQMVTGYTLALLYLMAPLSSVMQALPSLGEGVVALRRIEALGLSLTDHPNDEGYGGSPTVSSAPGKLELVGVSHHYQHEKEERGFVLGPLNLTLSPGELVFVIGGNGSGKSTLMLLIMGLYAPDQGYIRLNDETITDSNRENYRQQFAAVFSDPYLFECLLGYEKDVEGNARDLLAQFRLSHKVRIEGGRFSTLDLSQGQRKRLALLAAYLDDRPFYIFDEWAADQDPEFKAIFYTKLLPDLKKRGKTILVITHDDRYFHVADRCIKLVDGRLAHYDADVSVPASAT